MSSDLRPRPPEPEVPEGVRKPDYQPWLVWRSSIGGRAGRASDAKRKAHLSTILSDARSNPLDEKEDEDRGKGNRRLSTETREEIFANLYVQLGCNGQRAATVAGYGRNGVAAVCSHRLLRRPRVQAIIRRFREQLAMDVSETLAGIAEIARASWDDFLDEVGNVDLSKARKRGKLSLMKSYKIRETETGAGETYRRTVERHIELYDRLSAQALLAKHHGLLLDVHAVKRLPNNPAELIRELLTELRRTGQLEAFRQALIQTETKQLPETIDAEVAG